MPRKSPIHYIYPSAISVTPNANDSENDLAVTVIGGAKIKVYSPKSGISMSGGVYQEWSFTGRNRRLSQSGSPYTIYARLAKSDKSKGYLVFAPKDERDGKWYDKYCYVTPDGIFPQLSASHPEGCRVIDNVNWWIRLGDVSLPEGGKRTVSFDTGILGTDEFNTEWAVSPDSMPMRIEIGCVIDDEDAGPTPYVYWDKMLNLTATLVEGWTGTDIERFDHWEISRNTGDADADAAWPSAERASLFAHTGRMALSHERGALDDFNSAVATTFTVTAWGRPDDSQDPDAALVPMKEASIVILAETVEKYEVVLSSSVVSYNPSSDTYRPEDGIVVNVRATDQRSNVYRLGRGQINAARLVARYAHVDTESWSTLQFSDSPEGVAEAVIPVAAFAAQKNVNVRLENADGKELDSRVVSFLRDGEDSREREWIFFRSKDPVVFGDASSEHPLPSLISGGEVEPDGAASGEDTNKNQDGWVPQGWWDEQHGTDDEYRYEYSSYRDYVRSSESEGEGGHWDKFTKPNTWSYYGEDAVSYRCKWLLDGVEVWQLVSSYTGAFRGTLPLVATLMKRKGSGSEEPVAATDTVITVIFEGFDASYTEAASSPQFTISEVDHPEMVSYLNDARLTNILIVFETREETFSYSIPVIKEADEDSIIQTMEEHGSELFLSKTSDDTANGFITFAKGFLSLVDVVIRGAITAAEGVINNIRSSNYTGDGIADTGFRLTSDDGTGSSALTVDNLHVRKKATFEELEVKKETAVAGNEVRSAAANVINRTDYYDENGNILGYSYRQVPWLLKKIPFLLRGTFFGRLRKVRIELSSKDAARIARIRCYFLAKDDDRDVMNLWKADNINGHDLVRCQTFNLNSSRRYTYINGGTQKAGNVFWWRKAIAVSSSPVDIDGQEYHYVDVSNLPGGYAADSDIPAAGDHMVQFGNDSNSQRMNLIIQEINGGDAPAVKAYTGIYTFDLTKCWWGGSPRKMMLSPTQGYEFYGPSFKFVQEYGNKRASIDRGAWTNICRKTNSQGQYIDEWEFEKDDYGRTVTYSDDAITGRTSGVRKCYYYDKVTHNGCYWLCVYTSPDSGAHWVDANGNYITQAQYDALSDAQKATCSRKEDYTTVEPGTDDTVWQKQVDRGTSVKSVKSYYAKTNRALVMPRDDQEVTWEESLSALGEITEGWYVWTKNITNYSDTLEDTTTYTVSKWGIDGDGIENIETKFYEDSRLLEQEELSDKTIVPESSWVEYSQLSLKQGDYIYTRTRITYDKGGTPTISYQVNRIGQDGVSYLTTEEYYCLGNSMTTPPTGHPYQRNDGKPEFMTPAEMAERMKGGNWSESRPTYQGDANKYIWNFEVSYDTTTNVQVTQPLCIGDYSKGISTIVETYTISSHPTKAAMLADTAERTAHPWVDEVQDSAPTDELPYQWNKTVTSYSDGTSDTFYHVSAVKGTRGRGISNTNIYYKADSSTPATPSGAPAQSGWSDDGNTLITKANSDDNKHLYESTCTTFTDGNYAWTTPLDDGLISDMASTEEEFALADSGTTAPTSGWRTSVTPTAGKWVWSRTKLTFKSGTPLYKYINTQCVGYCGTDGKSITKSSEVREYQTSSSGTTIPTGTWLPENQKPTPAQGDYLWTRTTIRWSDTSTTVLYSAERNPNDGQAGQSITISSQSVTYSKQSSGNLDPTTLTYGTYPSTLAKGDWLYSKTTVTYSDNTQTDSYSVSYIGTDGDTGRGISSVVEEYAVNNDSSTAPSASAFSTTFPSTWDENNRYIWNREVITYTKGTPASETTTPRIKAIWTKDGKGIDSIVNRYLTNNVSSGITKQNYKSYNSGNEWPTTITPTSESNPYLWNFEVITYTDGDSEMTDPHVIGHFGKNGGAGQSTFKSIVFKRSNTSVSAPSGGSYTSPVPSGWSDGIPEGNEQLWCSTRIFTSDGQSPQQASWTTPRLMTDTADFDVEYSTVESNPGNPTSNPSNWSNTASSNTIWMATRECHNGTWSAWNVMKVKGEKPVAGEDYPIPQNGNDAYSVTIEPADMLFTQSTTKNAQGVYPLVDATKEATVIVKKGNSNNAVEHTISIGTYSGCNRPTISGDTITVEGKIGNYTEGYVNIQVDIANGPTFNLKLNLYYNLLGTWKRDVEDGTETVIAEKLSHEIFGDDVHTIEQTGQYVRGWGENTSILTKQVSGDNLFIGLDKSGSDCGWFSRAFGNSISYYPSSGLLQTSTNSPFEMISPLVYLVVGRVYCISAYFVQDKFAKADNIKLYKSDRTEYASTSVTTVEDNKTTGETMSYDQATWTRRYIRLKVNATGWYHISFYQINGLLYPQFEFSEYPTKFNVGGTTTQSMIMQTADEIEAKVNKTGVNITEGKIEATTNKFEIWNEDKTIQTFSVDKYGNIVGSGSASFKGSIITEVEDGGRWEISPALYDDLISIPQIIGYDKNDNPKIKLVFDGSKEDSAVVAHGGGLVFTDQEDGDNITVGGYYKNFWDIRYKSSSLDTTYVSSFINALPSAQPWIEFGCVVDDKSSNSYFGTDKEGIYIYSNKWPTSTTTTKTGRVYKDDWGYLKVKDTKTYDRINVRTSSFTLPDDPPVGTMFFVKRMSDNMKITTGNAYVLNGSNNGTLWEPGHVNDWNDGTSIVLFYLGQIDGYKYWTMIYSS